MRKLSSIALVGVAIVLAAASLSYAAAGHGGQGFSGHSAPPAYTYSPPPSTYWYYCPSYGAYYPTVPSCPEAWVPVPG